MLTQFDALALTTLRLRGYTSRSVPTSVGAVHILEARGAGTLPPLVLLHGFSSAGVHYAPLLERLRPHVRRLVAPDMPAHGFSEIPIRGLRPDALRSGLFEALDRSLNEPVILFGNSMGGMAAVHYALARPTRVLGVILCSPVGAAMDHAELSRFVRSFELASHAEALHFVDRLFARQSRMRQLFAWGVRKSFHRPSMRALLSSLGPDDFIRPEELRALEAPVLLIWGKGDRVFPPAHLAFFRRHLPPHARVKEPAHVGHSPFLEDPEGLAAEIAAFARDLGGARNADQADRARWPGTSM